MKSPTFVTSWGSSARLLHQPDDGAADDGAVGVLDDRSHLGRGRDPEADADGLGRDAPEVPHEPHELRRHLRPLTRDPGERDQVDEPAARARDPAEPLRPARRRRERDQVEARGLGRPPERPALVDRAIRHDQPGHARLREILRHPVEPVPIERVEVRHDDQRRPDPPAHLGEHGQEPVEARPPLERADGGALDRRAVREGIGEGQADLDHVRAAGVRLLDQPGGHLEARVAGDEVRDERALAPAAEPGERLVNARHGAPRSPGPPRRARRPGPRERCRRPCRLGPRAR